MTERYRIDPPSDRAADQLETSGGVFLADEDIDETEKGDGTDDRNTLENTYFAFGYPASKSHSRIQHYQRRIHVRGYSVSLTLAPTQAYPDGLSADHHLLLDYDTRGILLEGKPVNPPTVKGMSGCGIFRFHRRHPDTVKLVGILIELHKQACVIAGMKVATALTIGREVIAHHPEAFRSNQ